MQKTNVLIIGGGPGGIIAAITARKNNPGKKILLLREKQKGVIPCGIPYIFCRLDSVEKNVMGPKPFADLGGDVQTDSVIDVNLKGVFICCQEVLKFISDGGRIINIGSLSGEYGGPRTPSYAAAKAGVMALTHCLARFVGHRKITVNCVSPGVIESELTKKTMPLWLKDKIMPLILLGRLGKAEEVASVVAFLASDEASYITAQVISVMGDKAQLMDLETYETFELPIPEELKGKLFELWKEKGLGITEEDIRKVMGSKEFVWREILRTSLSEAIRRDILGAAEWMQRNLGKLISEMNEEERKMVDREVEFRIGRELESYRTYFFDFLKSRTLHYGPERIAYYLTAKWMERNSHPLWVRIVNSTIDYFSRCEGKEREEWLRSKGIREISMDDDNFRRYNYLWVPAVSSLYIYGHLAQNGDLYPDLKRVIKENKMPLILETPMAQRGIEEWLRLPNPLQMYHLAKYVNEEFGFDCLFVAMDFEHMLSLRLDPKIVIELLPEEDGGTLQALRYLPDSRRGGHRLLPDGGAVLVHGGGRAAGLPLPGQGDNRRIPSAGGHPHHGGGLRGVPGGRRFRAGVLPRTFLHRQPARGGRGPREPRAVPPGGREGEDRRSRRPLRRGAGEVRRAPSRGRRKGAGHDGGRGARPGPGEQGTLARPREDGASRHPRGEGAGGDTPAAGRRYSPDASAVHIGGGT